MRSQATFLLLSIFHLTMFMANAANNLRAKRDLGYGYDDAAAVVDDAAAVDDAADAGDDAVATDDATYSTTAYNGTITDKVVDYTQNHAHSTYENTPSEWSQDDWIFFGIVMFIFGGVSTIFFMVFVFPCCCPKMMRTGYAKFIAKAEETEPKKVRLIKK